MGGRGRLIPLVLLAALVGSSMVAGAFHYGTTVDQETPDPPDVSAPEEPPETGLVEPDERLSQLYGQTTDAIESFEADARKAMGSAAGQSPVRPIDLLDDDVVPGERHGGIGPWSDPDPWHRANASDREWTWRFGNASSGTYPSGEALLLSPVIDLSTLGTYTDFVPTWRSTGSAGPQDLYTLFLVHRFDFANTRERGLDGGRVEVFMNPSEESYEEPGTVLAPQTDPSYRDFVQALGSEGFSGSSNWSVSAFDLTPFAGHEVRIGFRVATVAFSEDTDRFQDDDLFASERSKGWLIDRARVTAPAVGDNVKVESFRSPERPEQGEPFPETQPGTAPKVDVPVANLGANARTVELTYRVTTEHPDVQGGPGDVLRERTESVRLAPGDVYHFRDQAWTPTENGPEVAWLGLEASIQASDVSDEGRDEAPVEDPERWQPVRVHAAPDLHRNLRVEPTIGHAGEERTVTYVVRNTGEATGFAAAQLEVQYRERPDDDWSDRTDELLEDPDSARNLAVRANSTDSTRWTIDPPDKGAYRLVLDRTPFNEDEGGPYINETFYAETGEPVWDPIEQLTTRIGQAGNECPIEQNWSCVRPQEERVPGSEDGAYWASPPGTVPIYNPFPRITVTETWMDLVGTPPDRLAGACLRVDQAADSGFPTAECARDLQESAGQIADGVEAGPDGPVRTVHPGYANLNLDVRYRALNVPLEDEPPVIRVEMANYDPIRSFRQLPVGVAGNFVQGAGALVPAVGEAQQEAITSPVHVDIALPPSNGTADQGLPAQKLEAGWRELSVDLDDELERATGVKNLWDLALEEVRVIRPASGQVLIDRLEVTGVPVDNPSERSWLLRTTGDRSDAVGEWTCRYEKNPAPRRSVTVPGEPSGGTDCPRTVDEDPAGYTGAERSRWVRVQGDALEGVRESAENVWTPQADGWTYTPTSETLGDTRLVTPSVRLPDNARPRLVLEHTYATPGEEDGGNPLFMMNGTMVEGYTPEYKLGLGYLVEVQYKRGDEWSPFYVLEPADAYPKPELHVDDGERRRLTGNGLRAGEVFYWPNGSVEGPAVIPGLTSTSEAHGSPRQVDEFPLRRSSGLGPPIDLSGRTVRLAFHAVADSGDREYNTEGVGWTLHDLEVWNRTPLGRNVRITEAAIQDGGDGTLGPGVEAPVEVTVENAGRFDEPSVEVSLTVAEGGGDESVEASAIKRIPAGANRTFVLPWTVPEGSTDGETFHLNASARPTENRGASSIRERVSVEQIEVSEETGVDVRTSAAPTIGTVGQVVSLDTTVSNPGTVPLTGVEVDREISRLGSSPVLVQRDHWSVAEPLSPSLQSVSLQRGALASDHTSSPPGVSSGQWTPSEPGTYRIQTRLSATSSSADTDTVQDTHDRVVRVLEPVFEDGFEGNREGGRAGVGWTTTGDAWAKRNDAGFRSSTSWWVGAGQEGYPHEANASLVSPPIDVSSAKDAFLTLATNYSTEPFYDGAVVELSTDGGQSWTPLEPGDARGVRGYPNSFSPANPAGSRDEDGRAVGGFSGTPPADERRDGWTVHTFPLGQVDHLTETEVVSDLVPSRADNGSLERLGIQYTRPSWELGDEKDARRFVVQNLTEAEPTPRTGASMWYTGPVGRVDGDQGDAEGRYLQLDVPSPPEDEVLQIRFEDWRAGVTPWYRGGTGACYEVLVDGEEVEPATPPTPIQTDWTPRWINVSGVDASGSTVPVVFEYQPDPRSDFCDQPIDRHASDVTDNRGWAIDDVSIRYADSEDQFGRIVHDDVDEGSPMWNESRVREFGSPRWRVAHGPQAVEAGWSARSSPTGPQDAVEWSLRNPNGEPSLPANLDTRLVSPPIDLRGVGERNVELHLDHEYRFQLREERYSGANQGSTLVEGGVVEVQIYNQTTGSFEPWRTLFREPVDLEDQRLFWATGMGASGNCMEGGTNEQICEVATVNATTMRSRNLADAVGYPHVIRGMGLPFEHVPVNFTYGESGELQDRTEPVTFLFTGSGDRRDRFDLSWLSGKRFRLGFHAWANPHENTIENRREQWTIEEARVEMGTFSADTVQTRVRFGSDGSVAGDHVAVDDVSLSQVSYDRNLELAVDDPVARSVEPGSKIWVNGTVENRGRAARDAFAVQVTGKGLPLSGASASDQSTPTDGDDGLSVRTETLAVGPAGTPSESTAFALPVQVPSDLPDTQGTLEVRLVSVLGDGAAGEAVRPLVDEVAGNKQAEVPVSVGRVADAELSLSPHPDRPRVGEQANLTVSIENTGVTDLSPRLYLNVSGPSEQRLVETTRTPTIPQDETRRVTVAFRPQVSGTYQVQAALVGDGVSATTRGELPVNASSSLLTTAWETGQDWLEWKTTTVDEQCPLPEPEDGDPRPQPGAPDWSRVDGAGVGGSAGLLFGAPDGSPDHPAPFQDAGLVTPSPVDLSDLEAPRLTFVHRPHFYSPAAGAAVEVQVVNRTTGEPMFEASDPIANCRDTGSSTPNTDGWFLVYPEGGYDATSRSTPGNQAGAPPQPQPPSDLSPLGTGHPILGGVSEGWRQVSVDLAEQSLKTPEGRSLDLENRLVNLRLRATTREDTTTPGEGWNVDGLLVGSDGLDVEPETAERRLVDGARKQLALDLTNPGERRNTYQVEIAEQGTTMPREWLDLSTETVTVPAGQTRPIDVTAHVPVSENNQRATYTLTLAVSSQVEPALLDFVTYTIHVVPSLHSNLGARLSTGADAVEVGESTLLSATVSNTGLAPNTPATAAFVVRGPDGEESTIAERKLPPIEPSRGGDPGSVTVTVPWTAPSESLGDYRFEVRVDPQDRIVEFNESDNRASRTLEVIPLQRPDLVVEPDDLDILHVDGSRLEAADPGDIVQVLVSVHNEGNEPAQRVRVSLSMGPDPVAQRVLDRLPPGTTRTFPFTVFAPGNTTVLSLDATTLESELDEDNNQARAPLPVRRSAVSIAPADGEIELRPNNVTAERLELVNGGSDPKLVRLSASDPAYTLEVPEREVLLDPGEPRVVEANLGVEPSISAGSDDLPVRVTDVGQGRSATVELPVTVAEEASLSIDAPSTRSIAPGPFTLSATVENTGNVPLSIRSEVTPPDGWGAPVDESSFLAPGETRQVTASLSPDNHTRAGSYPVRVEARVTDGPSQETTTRVEVQPAARASVSHALASAGTTPVVHELTIENTGNVRSKVALDVLDEPVGWTVETSGTTADLEPGEEMNATLSFSRTSDDAPLMGAFLARARLSPAVPVDQPSLQRTFTGQLNAMPPDVAVETVAASPRFGVQEGDAVHYQTTVENRGLGPAAPVSVHLYQNEKLVDASEIRQLPSGDAATVNFTVNAEEGLQTMVFSADPHKQLVDPDRANNALGRELVAEGQLIPNDVPGPEPVLWIGALAVLTVLAHRRKRRERP